MLEILRTADDAGNILSARIQNIEQLSVSFVIFNLSEDFVHGVARRHDCKGFREFLDWLAFEEYRFEIFIIHGNAISVLCSKCFWEMK